MYQDFMTDMEGLAVKYLPFLPNGKGGIKIPLNIVRVIAQKKNIKNIN